MSSIFRTQWNVLGDVSVGEVNLDPSMTVPDQSYSIQDLLDRYTSGTMPPIELYPIYDDSDTPDPMDSGSYDLSDYTSDMLAIDEAKKRKNEADEARVQANKGKDLQASEEPDSGVTGV